MIFQILFSLLGAIIVALIIIGVYHKSTNAFFKSNKRLDGKTCIVIGGTAGIGLEVAKDFARRGARLIITSQFKDLGIEVQEEIKKETGNSNVVFKFQDLSSLASTRNLAADIIAHEERIDILVNNAGMGAVNKLTDDGLNISMEVNYYGHFLLTNLLLPILKKSGTPENKTRIINVSSVCHKNGIYVKGDMNRVDYTGRQLYGNTKLCVFMFTIELAKRLKDTNVVTHVVNPGAVGTSIFITNYGPIRAFILEKGLRLLFKTPYEGSQTLICAALEESLNDRNGEYLQDCKIIKGQEIAYDPTANADLWVESVKIVNL